MATSGADPFDLPVNPVPTDKDKIALLQEEIVDLKTRPRPLLGCMVLIVLLPLLIWGICFNVSSSGSKRTSKSKTWYQSSLVQLPKLLPG